MRAAAFPNGLNTRFRQGGLVNATALPIIDHVRCAARNRFSRTIRWGSPSASGIRTDLLEPEPDASCHRVCWLTIDMDPPAAEIASDAVPRRVDSSGNGCARTQSIQLALIGVLTLVAIGYGAHGRAGLAAGRVT
jgi:hypothetical protein